MEKPRDNKMMTPGDGKIEHKSQKQEFFFAGGGKYEPRSIRASSRREAEEVWRRERAKVEIITSNIKTK